MNKFKNTIIQCQQCARKILVKPADFERGEILCSHVGCEYMNKLASSYYYDDKITVSLSAIGTLTYLNDPDVKYLLKLGINVIGTSSSCEVQVKRVLHHGKCFISRRHCTIEVIFDKWVGQLRYKLRDGAFDTETKGYTHSTNGTFLSELLLKPTEIIDIPDKGIISLGGSDKFRLNAYIIPNTIIETYKVPLDFDPDRTQ